jgi:glycosyltransferase involved in cell wall biosynthesis
VLFLIPSLEGGGAERVFSLLLCHLDRRRFEPHLAILQAQGAYLKDIPQDVVVHDLKVSRVRYALPRVLRLSWRLRPQALLSTLGHLNLALILAKPLLPPGSRLLVRQAAIASSVLPEETQHPGVWEWLYRHFYGRADKIICLSDSMVDDMIQHFGLPREKLVRIYNPVDIERVQELAKIGNTPFSGPGPHLVAAGRLARQKGFDVLLDAMPAVLEHFPSARLTILGEGPLRFSLADQARRLNLTDAVRFPGFQQDPWRYLKHADLFVLSSRYEGLPNIMLEAMALGTPVVATDCPGAIREVQDCDDRMLVVPTENPAALGRAIISVCEAGRTRCEKPEELSQRMGRFSLPQAVREYSKLF